MKLLAVLFAFAVAASANLASAQDIDGTTGTHLNHYATTKDIPELRLQYARCIASSYPNDANAWLQSIPGTEEEDAIVKKIIDGSCYGTNHIVVDGTELSMATMRVRLLVAQAIVEKKINKIPDSLPSQKTDKRWFDNKLNAVKDGKFDHLAILVDDFGECVVQNDWTNSKALLKSRQGSPAEAAIINMMVPELGPCLTAQQLSLDSPMLRSIIANGLYHVAFSQPLEAAHAGN